LLADKCAEVADRMLEKRRGRFGPQQPAPLKRRRWSVWFRNVDTMQTRRVMRGGVMLTFDTQSEAEDWCGNKERVGGGYSYLARPIDDG